MKTKLHFVLSLSMLLSLFYATAQQNYWQKTDINLSDNDGNSELNEKFYQTYKLDLEAFKIQLSDAPLRSTSVTSNTKIYLPNHKGEMEQFRVVEAPVLSEELSQLYPNIKTYLGFSIDNPGKRARFSVTPQGLQTMVTSSDDPLTFTVPTSREDNTSYISYTRDVRGHNLKDYECLTEDEFKRLDTSFISKDANDQVLRTFRIAISTTGEYTNFWDDGNAGNGNAQQDALAQVVSTLNRNNEVFEVDMAVTFTLISGTSIIYPNAGSDPYTGAFNTQLQTTLTNNIGEANYDIGHLFAFGGNNGNAGCIGCVCVNNQKGSGFSSHSFLDNDGGPYMSDFFDIDYVPHEIGHQMGANHTWSFNSEGTGVNAEPGSGTTIMGYAGITGGNDVQDHSDAYFHYYSILQVLNNLQARACWVGIPITNNPPVAEAGPNYVIPNGTPFVLKGAATDADGGDILYYNWEQIDNGITTTANFGPTKATGAVWRSRPPSTSPDRYMPIVERVISNQLTQTNPVETLDNSSWETVSTVARTLNFALIVRDRSEANGVAQTPQSSYDTMEVTVDGVAGPFVVTSQITNETWDVGSNQTITWNVAGTDTGAVNTPTVNILLSADGGFTYPFTLATNVPNDGSHDIIVPATGDTSTARVKVEGNNNIFYAINPINFSIEASEFVLNVADTSVDVCSPDNAIFDFTYNTFLGFAGTTTFSATGLPVGASAVFSPTTASTDGTNVTVTISGTGGLATGNYPFTLVGTSGSTVKTADVEFNVFDATFATLSGLTPTDGATDVSVSDVVFTWNADSNATNYEIDIATDASFTNIIESTTVNDPTYTVASLNVSTQYFWRVRAGNDCGSGPYSQASFTTGNIVCNFYSATDLPIDILLTSNGTDNYTSVINVAADEVITDVNVTVNIMHGWNNDLDIFLISPSGTIVELSTDNGADDDDDYTNTVFDQEATNPITTGTSPFTGTFIPEGDLSTLYGEMSGGDWTLSVDDDFPLFDGGQITGFTLEICTQQALSVGDVTVNDNTFSIYPNPNKGEFTVSLNNPSSDKIEVALYDIRGRSVYAKTYSATTSFNAPIRLDNVQSGVYLVRVKDGANSMTKKLVIN